MRPRLYNIGHKVNSLLFEPSLSIGEKCILPQISVLCMTRNKEEDHGQDREDTKYKELPKKLQRADFRTTPDDRPLTASGRPALGRRPAPEDQPTPATAPGERTSDRAPDVRPRTGRPAILTEVRDFRTSGVPTTEHFQWTSGTSGRPVPPGT